MRKLKRKKKKKAEMGGASKDTYAQRRAGGRRRSRRVNAAHVTERTSNHEIIRRLISSHEYLITLKF